MRSYGRFTTSIWRDPDFTSLTLEQQAVYFTLGLQPEVSAAGTLALTERRWAALSDGTNRADMERIIRELVEHAGRHLVLDEDTEELLIRKFIKWDQGWTNEKRWPLVRDGISAISSIHIRDIAVDELRKLALSDGVPDVASRRAMEWVSDRESRSDRDVVTLGEYVPQPSNPILEREPSDAAAPGPLSPYCSKHPDGTEEPCGPCATARERYKAHVAAKLNADVERRAAAERRKSEAVQAEIADAKANATPRVGVA